MHRRNWLSHRFVISVVFCFVLSVLLAFPAASGFGVAPVQATVALPLQGLPVHNLNTTLSYASIQAAIDAPETLPGHVIQVDSGVYHERVSVNKPLSLVGQVSSSTVIDGSGGAVVQVGSGNVEIRDFTIRNGTFGISVVNSENVKIIGNLVSRCSYGIRLFNSTGSRIVQNYVTGSNSSGIDLGSSGNSFLRDNELVSNRYNLGVDGTSLLDFLNDIDGSNIVDGKPITYLVNQRNVIFDGLTYADFGYVAFVNSSNITVRDIDVQNNRQGLLFAFVENSSISGVNAAGNWDGIYITNSNNILVSWTNANYNREYGIRFFNSPHSSAVKNNADNNTRAGIGLYRSPGSLLDENEANFNTYNLEILYTNNSLVTRNNASGLASDRPRSYSIVASFSHNNRIYHNAFSTVLLGVELRNGSRFTPTNKWDNGAEGNYWTYYPGFDDDHDGVGDTVYGLGDNNVDLYPLMGRYRTFIVLFDGKLYSLSVISNSTVRRLELNSTGTGIRLFVSGRNGTSSFCRIAVPKELLQNVGNSSVDIIIDRLQSTLVRNWTDGNNYYWYFSYVFPLDSTRESVDLWPFVYVLGAVVVLIVGGLVAFLIFRKRRSRMK